LSNANVEHFVKVDSKIKKSCSVVTLMAAKIVNNLIQTNETVNL